MAKLFGYPINVEAEEEKGEGSSIAGEASRSATQPYGSADLPHRESNHPYSLFLSSPLDSESDLNNCFIDFFGRESNEIETVGELYTGMQRSVACDEVDICVGSDDMDEGEDVELGLGIGSGSGQLRGDSVRGDKETDSGRVEVVTDLEDDLFVVEEGCMSLTPFEDDLFCEEEAMLMADEVLEWEFLQNDITWESEPVQASLFSVEEEEEEEDEEEEEEDTEEEEAEELALPYNANPFLQNPERQVFTPVNNNNDAFVADFYEESLDAEDILMEAMEGTSLMDLDLDYADVFLHVLGGEDHGEYYDDVFAHSFTQEPPPPVMGTRPASKRVVDDLPVVGITSEELSKGSIVCAICIGDVVVEEKVTRLPCRHYYHGECIVPWLGMKNTCPVCRYELPTDDVEYERNRSQRL